MGDIAEPQANRDIVLAAVANDGFAVRHASDALRADREAAYQSVPQKTSSQMPHRLHLSKLWPKTENMDSNMGSHSR